MLQAPTARKGYLPLFLSILFPTSYRVVLEIVSWPYPIGYDPLGVYAPIVAGYVPLEPGKLYSLGPVYYLILQVLYLGFNEISLAMKVGAVCSVAALSATLYLYTTDKLGAPWKGFLAAVLVSFYFPVLRMSWDLHRNTLGIALFLLTLWLSTRNRKAALAVGVIAALAHPTIPPLLFAALLPTFISVKDKALLLVSLAIMIVWLTMATLGNWLQLNYLGVLLLAYLTIPALPWIVASIATSVKHKTNLETAMMSAASVVFSSLPSPELIRYALLAPFYLVLHAVVACLNAKWKRQAKAVIVIALAVVIGVFASGYTLEPTESPFPYFAPPCLWDMSFLNSFPTSMQQNTLPLDQAKHTSQILTEARNVYSGPDHVLVANQVILGYAIMAGYPREKVVFSMSPANADPILQARRVAEQSAKPYTVWFKPGSEWYGLTIKQPDFRLLMTNGNMGLYGFVYTNVGNVGVWRIENGTVLGDSTGLGRTFMLTPAQVTELDLKLQVRIESTEVDRWGKAGFVLWKNSTTYYFFGITSDAATGKLYPSANVQNGTHWLGPGRLLSFDFNSHEWYTLRLRANRNGTFQFLVNDEVIGRLFNTQISAPWRLGLISGEGMKARFDDQQIVDLLWGPTSLADLPGHQTVFDYFSPECIDYPTLLRLDHRISVKRMMIRLSM